MKKLIFGIAAITAICLTAYKGFSTSGDFYQCVTLTSVAGERPTRSIATIGPVSFWGMLNYQIANTYTNMDTVKTTKCTKGTDVVVGGGQDQDHN